MKRIIIFSLFIACYSSHAMQQEQMWLQDADAEAGLAGYTQMQPIAAYLPQTGDAMPVVNMYPVVEQMVKQRVAAERIMMWRQAKNYLTGALIFGGALGSLMTVRLLNCEL